MKMLRAWLRAEFHSQRRRRLLGLKGVVTRRDPPQGGSETALHYCFVAQNQGSVSCAVRLDSSQGDSCRTGTCSYKNPSCPHGHRALENLSQRTLCPLAPKHHRSEGVYVLHHLPLLPSAALASRFACFTLLNVPCCHEKTLQEARTQNQECVSMLSTAVQSAAQVSWPLPHRNPLTSAVGPARILQLPIAF